MGRYRGPSGGPRRGAPARVRRPNVTDAGGVTQSPTYPGHSRAQEPGAVSDSRVRAVSRLASGRCTCLLSNGGAQESGQCWESRVLPWGLSDEGKAACTPFESLTPTISLRRGARGHWVKRIFRFNFLFILHFLDPAPGAWFHRRFVISCLCFF